MQTADQSQDTATGMLSHKLLMSRVERRAGRRVGANAEEGPVPQGEHARVAVHEVVAHAEDGDDEELGHEQLLETVQEGRKDHRDHDRYNKEAGVDRQHAGRSPMNTVRSCFCASTTARIRVGLM